jgi:hypothetical protein
MGRFLERLKKVVQGCLDILFMSPQTPLAKWMQAVLLMGLFVAGILHWGTFLNWSGNRFDFLDWHNQVGPYLEFLSKALKSGQLPLVAKSPYMIPGEYLARQNRPFSPQILLLYFLNPATYVLVNVWIFYSIGFVGLLLIRRRYHLSLVSFLALFLLFNLNGHILAHFAVGHFEWVGYFLLPFYVLLIMKMLEGEQTGWKWLFSMALLMLALTLQGFAHFFIYCMAFLLLIGLFRPQYFLTAVKAILLSGLLCMIRILPPALQYGGGTGLKDLGGFVSVFQLLQSFILPGGDWEKEYYVGVIGFAFILYFGIIRNWMKSGKYHPLYFSMLVFAFFSIGSIYLPLFNSHIPFMDSQRAPSRFLALPLVFLIFLACIKFQHFLEEWEPKDWEKKIVVLFGEGLMAYDLFYHSRVWSLEHYSPDRVTDIIKMNVSNIPDPRYVATLILGFLCTMITLTVLIWGTVRERQKNSSKFPGPGREENA